MQTEIKYEYSKRERIDSFLASAFKDYSRSYFQKLITDKQILINDKEAFASSKLKFNDIVKIEFPQETLNEIIKPQKIKLNIIYEDCDILIINKQSDIVVHPSYGHEDGSLLNGLVYYAKGKFKPYLVHRLDKDTSGIIIFAKNEKSKISLSKQFQKRAVKKYYLAAAKGFITENSGRIEAPIGRSLQNRKIMSVNAMAKKQAISEFNVLQREESYTLLKVRIITGRTHQIRSHLKYINHPVLGDLEYGGPTTINGKTIPRQMLHSYHIIFTHPTSSKTVEFKAKLPKDMSALFKGLRF
jgi:23S rRNA pseudouridine1911/1915/1917 synthase